MKPKKKIKVGISIGDLNGIGIEVILKTFKDNRMMDFCTPIIFGSSKVMSQHRKALGIQDFSFNMITTINDAHSKKVNLLNIWKEDININLGEPSKLSGEYALESIKNSCKALAEGKIDVLVTAPIDKSSIQQKVKEFVGHTEFLEGNFEGEALMIMVSEVMKIAFVTGHIPLSKVKTAISIKKIIKKTNQLNQSLIADFGYRKPKIAIIGLNPHAGENGMLGTEEKEIIVPAIKQLKKEGIIVFGPYPADSFFTQKNLLAFDGILSMYHDQGLTPFKTLSFSEGVNYTAGLNIIRTSPVHGTGYEIAGKAQANEQSFREAVFLACKLFRKRLEYKELNKDTLLYKTTK
tara:strand:- start:28 stop:1074 length:1047 start_codon:yes stop_codon:yes gene_type:complete